MLLNAVCSSSLISMELKWVRRSKGGGNNSNRNLGKLGKLNNTSTLPLTIPVYISTERKDVNPQELRDLYTMCNHSCHRFPCTDPESGNVEEVIDVDKLWTAITHSTVLVSVFCRPQYVQIGDASNCDHENNHDTTILCSEEERVSFSSYTVSSEIGKQNKGIGSLGDLIQKVVPFTPSDGQLVGFGRAVSDCGLTASIYDVMVTPSLCGMGIGKLIVRRIIRILTNEGIYDIAALCSENERLFFEACGFGDDILGSTTMMYTKTLQGSLEGDSDNQLVRRAGRRLLLAPPHRKPFASL